jgi:ABC-type spermidine/putrescine transport system permease subunit II
VLIGMIHSMMPLAIITMIPIMQRIDANLFSAAQTMGASSARAFWQVYFPLSMPGVAAAGLLVFVYSLGFFIVPALLGGPRQSGLAQIIISQIEEVLNWQFASALACVLLLSALVACFLYDRVVGLTAVAGGSGNVRSAKGRSRKLGLVLAAAIGRVGHALTFGRSLGFLLPCYSALGLIFLVVPSLIIIPSAFTSAAFLDFPPVGFSLRWFHAVINSAVWMGAIERSLFVAMITACLATLVGGLAALSLARTQSRLSGAVFGLFLAPLIVPRVVIALGMFYLFAQIGLVATDTALVIGHTVLAIPFVLVSVIAVLKNYDWRLDSAAAILGASRFTTIRRITIPLIAGGIGAAFILAFITSLDELTVAIFVSGGVKTTLPKQMWDDLIVQLNPTLAAASAIMLGIIVVLLVAGELIRRPHLRRQRRPILR